jgi:hypothetical protein
MKRLILFAFGILVTSMTLLVGCSSPDASNNANEVKASPGQEFTLQVNQTAVISSENLSVKFNAVTNDSRCPKGAQCIWAGEAKCQMQVTYNGAASQLVLTETGGTDGFSQSTYQNYKIDFQLQPYPEVGKQLASADYKLVMRITK